MANDSLMINDELRKNIENIDKSVKKLSESTKNLGINSNIVKKSLQDLGKVGTIAFNGLASGNIDKAIKNITQIKNFADLAQQSLQNQKGTKRASTELAKLANDCGNLIQMLKKVGASADFAKFSKGLNTKSSSDLAREQEKARIQEEKAYQQRRKRILAERELVHKQINESYDGSLRFSDNAKTINDRAKAIENMRKAYNKLDPSVETNKVKMARLNLEIKKQESALRRLQGETAKTSNAMGQWASRLGALFGINAISNFVRKMVTVRGEFELQQKSLEVLLKSKSEANKLWEQTMQLAVKSPFQVGQLITYTKQLAAYQIETDKLFDTTKRLADLSAGLGVDMDRLILAYGQVRTAEYLRATEVRQFTEAGVPLLDALADRFSALEGKAVSVAEVMERITKRQVTFGDVEAVINQMTDLGGLFYNMQEEQSKTVKGMMSNLKDEISLMFNEIGESSEGAIKRSLQVVRWLVQHWEVFAGILASTLPLFALYKVNMLRFNTNLLAVAQSWGIATKAGQKYLSFTQLCTLATQGLTKAFKSLTSVIKKNPFILIASAAIAAGTAIYKYITRYDELKEKALEVEKVVGGITVDMRLTNNLEEAKENLNQLANYAENELKLKIDIQQGLDSLEKVREEFFRVKEIIQGQINFNMNFDMAVEDVNAFWGREESLATNQKDMYTKFFDFKKELNDYINTYQKSLSTETLKILKTEIKTVEDYAKVVKTLKDEIKSLYEQQSKSGGLDPLRFTASNQNRQSSWVQDLQKDVNIYTKQVDDVLKSMYNLGYFTSKTKEELVTYFQSRLKGLNLDEFGWDIWKQKLLGYGVNIDNLPNDRTEEEELNKASKAESLLSRRIELIKKMQSEYEKLNDYMSNTTALERVKDRFAEAAKELDIDISDIQFAKPEDVETAFRRIKTASKKEKAELEKTIGDIQLDLEIKDAEKKLDVLKSEIDNLFTQYDLTIELQKLNVPPQLMKDLFGLDSTSLSDIRKKIEDELSVAKTQEGGNEKIVEALEADRKKVEEKEKQHLENRLKEYVKFTRNAMSENAKLKYEELKALADIENTFEEAKQGKTDDEKVRIEEAKQQAILGYQKQTTEKMQELQWQAFKNSDMFASIFNDLDTVSDLALSNMIAQLENYKEEWSDLPINEMKEVINQIEKMQNAMNKRKALANPFKDTKVYSKQNVETAEHKISSATIENQELTQQIADLEVIIQLENEKKDATAQIIAFQEKYNTDLSIGASIIKAELEDYKKYNAEIIAQNKDIINKYELQKLKLQEQANIYKEIDSQAQKLYDAFKDLSEVLGADDDSAVAIFADMGMSMASTVLQTLALQAELQAATVAAGTFGAAMNTAMGIIGWIVMAVQLITAGLKAAFDFHDNSKQREIENLQEHIDSLAKSYEELSKAMDMAYSMDRMSNAYRMAQANIEAQKKAIKEQIELEKEKWNTDKEKVKEYEEQLEELDKQSEDLKQQLIDSMGGITDTSSKAREFVDAWVDAFKETGDGLSGLEENFDVFFDNLIREQISKQVIGSITQRFAEEVNKAIMENGDSGEITDVEWRQLQQLANASKEQMNNAMQMYRQFFEESGAGLSGLQEGIKGITESQADIIASYLNSIRMFVSEKAVNVREIRNILMGINGQPNPMLDELKRVAKHTENIRDLLLKVSDPLSNTLKVSIYQ
jgi:hypothetical protein